MGGSTEVEKEREMAAPAREGGGAESDFLLDGDYLRVPQHGGHGL